MASSVKKNFAYQMIYELLIFVLPFVTSPYIARIIGAEGLGTYSYYQSIAYYFVLISMLGLKNHGNREIARCREHSEQMNQTFSDLLCLHVIVSVLCSVVYFLYASLKEQDKVYAMTQLAYVLSALFDISWFFFGIEKFKLTVTRNIIIRIATVICVFVFVKDSDDLAAYCMIMAIGQLVSQLTLWVPLRKYVKFVKPSWSSMKSHILPLLSLFIPAVAVSMYKYMDKIMIGCLADKTQLGYYENAEKVINIPLTIISSFGTVMLPKMSNLATKSNDKSSQYLMSVSMKYVMCLAFAFTGGLAGVATVFAPVFWGKEFIASGGIIMGLSTTIPFIAFANVIRTQYLIPNKRDKDFILSVVAGAIINIIINALLISKMGAYGATVGTIVAEILVCLIQTFAVYKILPIPKFIRSFLPFFPVTMLMFGIVWIIGRALGIHASTIIVQILSGGLLYFVFTVLFLHFNRDPVFSKMLAKISAFKKHNQ